MVRNSGKFPVGDTSVVRKHFLLNKRLFVLSAAIFLALSSCGGGGGADKLSQGNSVPNQSNGYLSIINNDSQLKALVTEQEILLAVEKTGAGHASTPEIVETDFSLTLVAEIPSPIIDGVTLQATSVTIKHGKAVVSYNVSGERYLGGIQIFDITHLDRPVLNSQALFTDTDINAVTVGNGKVYGVGASDRGGFDYPAILEVINLRRSKMVLEGNRRLGLASYAGTSVISGDSNRLFATSGNVGGLASVDETAFAVEDYHALADARWVDAYNKEVIVVQGGTATGKLSIYDSTDGSLAFLRSFTFDGATDPEAKTTVEVVGKKAFIAAGTAGVLIVSIDSGELIGSIPNPSFPHPAAAANAVTVKDHLIFISNGEAGVYVVKTAEPTATSSSEEPLVMTLLGKLQFDSLQSVNHVAYRGKYLFVAAGMGGLKIVRVDL